MKRYRSPLCLLALFFSIIVFFELVFKVRLFSFRMSWSNLLTMSFLRTILFTLSYGFFVLFALRFFNTRAVKRLIGLFSFTLMFLYFSQDIYFHIANNFYSFTMTSDFAKGLTFFYRVYQSLEWGHLFYFIPVIVIITVLHRASRKGATTLFDIRFTSYKEAFATLILGFVCFFGAVATISHQREDDSPFSFSDWELYREHSSSARMINEYGLLTFFRKDFGNTIFPRQDTFDYEAQLIDFLDDRPGHEANEMTGVFEGKNLIIIMAEALDTYAIDPSLSPNLYSLMGESWVFSRFYAPHYLRNTADTEFMTHTGFYANTTRNLSMGYYSDNAFPNTFPRLFAKEGYRSAAFHNFSDYFYPRETFMPHTLGFDHYYNDETLGLEVPEERHVSGRHYWHSDVDLFREGLPYIIGEDPFFAYFLTVTGHLPYDIDRHDYIYEHYPHILDIWESEGREEAPDESILYYHASQWELDLAIGYLLDALEREGVLEDTVIVIFGDHYAYGLERDIIWEYDTVKDDRSKLNIHNVPFIIHAPGITDTNPQTYDNVFASVDILPTLSNMFGLDLEYNLIMGQDAFNSVSNTVIFANESFLTEDYFYDGQTIEFGHFTDAGADVRFPTIEGEILHWIRLNNYILDSDYFREDDAFSDDGDPHADETDSTVSDN